MKNNEIFVYNEEILRVYCIQRAKQYMGRVFIIHKEDHESVNSNCHLCCFVDNDCPSFKNELVFCNIDNIYFTEITNLL